MAPGGLPLPLCPGLSVGCVSSVLVTSLPLDTAPVGPYVCLELNVVCAPSGRVVVADNMVEMVQGTLEPNVQADHN